MQIAVCLRLDQAFNHPNQENLALKSSILSKMKEKGINSTFKKLIFESSEMVFLADDTYPYSIFYSNESFEESIGSSLNEKSLIGLGLDISNYIFKEELQLVHDGREFSFRLELPQDAGTNYFLFYKGKELRAKGLPSGPEIQQFFKRQLDLLAVGKHDYLTYLNPAVLPVLGYHAEELLQGDLCHLIHPDDLTRVRKIWKKGKAQQMETFFHAKIKGKDGQFRYLEFSVQFSENNFNLIARDVSESLAEKEAIKKELELQQKAAIHGPAIAFHFDATEHKIDWDKKSLSKFGVSSKKDRKSLLEKIKSISEESINIDQVEKKFAWGQRFFSLLMNKEEGADEKDLWVGALIDETSQKLLEDEKELFKSFLELSAEPILVVKGDGEFYFQNQIFSNLLHTEDLEIKSLDDLCQVFEESSLLQSWLSSHQDGNEIKPWLGEASFPNGKSVVLELSCKLHQTAKDSYRIYSFKDVTEKSSLEKTLEESSNFLINLTEQVPGGLYQLVLDQNGKMNFSFLSKGISSVLGISESEIEEFNDITSALTKVHTKDIPNLVMSTVASARKLEPWQCQFRVRDEKEPSGFRWVMGAARPQVLENGDMVWYGYLTDISNQKEFESKLDDARQTAEKASQIKSDFLSMISHELRTPLNAISGSVYSLKQENPTDSQLNTLQTISFAVDNLIIMINDLLDFQKIEAGKLSIENAPFHLSETINQVLKGLAFHARDSKNQLNLDIDPNLNVIVKSDKTRLSQILNNLITNALKFTHEGQVDVRAKFLGQKVDRIKIHFEVQDTGVGIAKEHQERIFDDFDQVKPSFNSKYGGTGLGLSITRRLLKLMGSNISLESEVGKGSVFYFDMEFELDQDQTPKGVILNGFNRDFSTLHLLMAEDNDVNALVLGKIIKKWGYTYDRVPNGSLAVDAVQSKNYDCILMDIQMPVMDGFEATERIKAIKEIPIIALTAAAKLEIMERIESSGFDGFVAKPIDAAELLKAIKEVVSAKSHQF